VRRLGVITLALGGVEAATQQLQALMGGAYTGSFTASATTVRLSGRVIGPRPVPQP
jgi:hypothetical protein